MTEDFLHFIWRTHSFSFHTLQTTDGVPVEILEFGTWNHGAGPDFSMGRIRLDGIEWIGNIEIHLRASDWNRHGHSDDGAYANVVLHVVLEEDCKIYIGDRRIPCVELKQHIDKRMLGRYVQLMARESWVPCAGHLPRVSSLVRDTWLDRMLFERLETKAVFIAGMLEKEQYHWEVALYRSLAVAYGFKTNAHPFERLALSVPLKIVYQHQDSLFQLEALYFGTAGLLNELFMDEYAERLQREYHHLSTKYRIEPIGAHAWKWGRLRPANFPSVRIAQFAALMTSFQGLFRVLLETPSLHALQKIFEMPVSPYWKAHRRFGRPVRSSSYHMGPGSVNGLLINTVVPFLFYYGRFHGEEHYVERALDLMSEIPAEQNIITRRWHDTGMPNHHAAHSQALIHLKPAYCDRKRCVECAIGNQVLTSNYV